jgi:Rrf2 family protein
MKVSKRGEYGMRALCHLAERYDEGLTHIRDIAAQEEIPPKFLEGILLALKRAGFVRSRRGNEGGYALARAPGEIMVGEVIRSLDGPLAPLASEDELKVLSDRDRPQCGLYLILLDVHEAVTRILDRTSLADVIERGRRANDETSGAGEKNGVLARI